MPGMLSLRSQPKKMVPRFFSTRAPLIDCKTIGPVAVVSLQRQEKQNALSHDMILELTETVHKYKVNPHIKTMVLRNEGEHFCSGGDIEYLLNGIKTNDQKIRKYFKDEYYLNWLLGATHLDKENPFFIISCIRGNTMGGGIGISGHARYRIISDEVKWGFPECKIGFFPDVGASYLLRNNPFRLYIALLGPFLTIKELLSSGFATHYISDTTELILQLSKIKDTRHFQGQLENVMYNLTSATPIQPSIMSDPETIEKITRYFNPDSPSVDSIIELLRINAEKDSWCAKTLKKLMTLSPNSLRVTHFLISNTKPTDTLAECLDRDYAMTKLWFEGENPPLAKDFLEGVSCIVDPTKKSAGAKPKWLPSQTLNLQKLCETEKLGLGHPQIRSIANATLGRN